MSGFVIFQCEGGVIWNSFRKPRTILVSCKSEMSATNECTKIIQRLWHVISDLLYIDLYQPTKYYYDNHACVYWLKFLIIKGMKYFSLHKNYIRECVYNSEL